MAHQLDWHSVSRDVSADRRESRRVAMAFSITVSGITHEGEEFTDKTHTVNISEHGCCFESIRELEHGEMVAITIHRKPAKRTHRFQVVWVEKAENMWLVGANLIQSKNIWGVVFPPTHKLRVKSLGI